MTIYIDNDYRCYVTDDGARESAEVEYFDGKCREFIEGYRYVPEGESWTRSDGEVFGGEMLAPWKAYDLLAFAQSAYEGGLAEADETIAAMVEEIYNMDMGGIMDV